MGFSIGDVLDGKYRVVRVIGEGGMGTVYEGEHMLIRRRVAIKALLPSVISEDVVRRFEREAQAAGQIGNDHILEMLDLGMLPTGEHYMVMEYLDGETLADRLRARVRVTAEELSLLIQQALVALCAAHAAGIIHRDLKPENLFILREKAGRQDFVKLIDFGISKFTSPGPESLRVTKVGTLLGTPCYMSPEQVRGTADADARTDVYALGVIMYEAVSGRLPFDSNTFNDLLFKIVLETPPPVQTLVADLDSRFAAIVMRAMAKDPGNRFQSATEFAAALGEWMRTRTIPQGSSLRFPSGMFAPGADAAADPATTSGPAGPRTTGPGGASIAHARTLSISQAPAGLPRRSRSAVLVVGAIVALAVVALAVLGVVARPTPRPAPAAGPRASNPALADSSAPIADPAEPIAVLEASAPVVGLAAAASTPAASAEKKKTVVAHPKPSGSAKSSTGGVPDFGY